MKSYKILENELGFFFSCYKEKDAVEFCFENIRKYYPKNPIFIASDGGENYQYICDSKTKFVLYEDILGYVNNPETKDTDKLVFCCLEFLKRLKSAIEFCNTEYIMYYEPDVFLRKNISIEVDTDICGSFSNKIHNNVLDFIDKYNPQNINKNFGACGGSILKTKSLIIVLEKTTEELLKEIIQNDKRVSNCDYLLTVIFSIFGFIYSENEDFIEANRIYNWESTNHAIVHQFHKNYLKNYYGKYQKS